jgi:hypothetical protein
MKPYSTKINVILLITLLLILPHRAKAQGNLVINGGFDVDASGWTLTNVLIGYDALGGDPGGYLILTAGVSKVPMASQTIIDLTPSTTYFISGSYIAFKGNSTDPSFGVAVDGIFLFDATDPGDFTWHDFDFLYTATSPSVVLSFSSQLNGTGISYGIDNISMEAVPEPSASWLILLGSGVLFYVRRNKKHSRV